MRADEARSAAAGAIPSTDPAFHIIVLGAGGGPNEDNVAGLLVKSTSTQWTSGSVLAVDAGVHLAAIIKIIEEHLPNAVLPELSRDGVTPSLSASEPAKLNRILSTGPFANLELPYESARANGAFVLHNLISTYLITHPHLDHVSGVVINTASFQQTSRPKRLAALPSTIDAIKNHIFNDIIWPNLSDENGGVGLVSYMRLMEGGNNALGHGEGQGYIEVCDGLTVKCWSVSHGQCMRSSHYHSNSLGTNDILIPNSSKNAIPAPLSISTSAPQHNLIHHQRDKICAYDSSAFFLRDDQTGREVLVFGDVEPDSLSLAPRTFHVWNDAAVKIVNRVLMGIFIECSYDDSQSDETLFGHLAPRHLITELQVLADKVKHLKQTQHTVVGKKRPRHDPSNSREDSSIESHQGHKLQDQRRRTRQPSRYTPAQAAIGTNSPPAARNPTVSSRKSASRRTPPAPHSTLTTKTTTPPIKPLEGLEIIIIHVKNPLRDGCAVDDTILAQLQHHEEQAQLGVVFRISQPGTAIWL